MPRAAILFTLRTACEQAGGSLDAGLPVATMGVNVSVVELWNENFLKIGGGGRNRTGVHGFAGRCMTTLPPRRVDLRTGIRMRDGTN